MKANNAKAYHAELVLAKTVKPVPRNCNSPSGIDSTNHMKKHVLSGNIEMNHVLELINFLSDDHCRCRLQVTATDLLRNNLIIVILE